MEKQNLITLAKKTHKASQILSNFSEQDKNNLLNLMGRYFHQTIHRNLYNLARHNKSFLISSNRISNKKYKYYKNDYLTR